MDIFSDLCCGTIQVLSNDNREHIAMDVYVKRDFTDSGRVVYGNRENTTFIYWNPVVKGWKVICQLDIAIGKK